MKSLFNDSTLPSEFLIIGDDPSQARKGVIYSLANDANFDAAHLSEALTQFILGVPDLDNLQAALDALAPPVPVPRRFSYKTWNEKSWAQEDSGDNQDIRKIGGEFAMVTSPGATADGATDNKGLSIVIDNDDGGEDPAVQQHYVRSLRQRLLRSELRRVLTLLTDNATELAAGAPNWGSGNAARDPDGDLLTLVDESFAARGIAPNILALGGLAAVRRKLALRGSDKAGAFTSSMMNNAQLAELIGVDQVVNVNSVYQSSSTAKSRIAGSIGFTYFAQQGATKEDPSNLKRFITMTPSGLFRVYIEAVLKRTKISVEHYSRNVATSATGIQKVTPTFTA